MIGTTGVFFGRESCWHACFAAVLLAAACPVLSGCSRAPAQALEASAPTVTVSMPVEREVTDHEDYTGRMAAIESVMVLAGRERLPGEDQLQGRGGSKARRGPLRNRSATVPGTLRRGAGQLAQSKANLRLATQTNDRFKFFVGSAGRRRHPAATRSSIRRSRTRPLLPKTWPKQT